MFVAGGLYLLFARKQLFVAGQGHGTAAVERKDALRRKREGCYGQGGGKNEFSYVHYVGFTNYTGGRGIMVPTHATVCKITAFAYTCKIK